MAEPSLSAPRVAAVLSQGRGRGSPGLPWTESLVEGGREVTSLPFARPEGALGRQGLQLSSALNERGWLGAGPLQNPSPITE